jgi:sacsin
VLLWQYLQNQCENFLLCGDWPILPSTSGHLYRVSKQSKLISAAKLSIKMRDILAMIGCKILNPNYGVEHPDLCHYVCDADAAGVLESIFDVVSSDGCSIVQTLRILGVEERNELRGFLFDPKWYIGDCMDDSNIRNCKMLPIYRVFGGGSSQGIQFSDLENPRKYLPPYDVPEYFLGGEFIVGSSTREEEILLRYYGIERMGKAFFYRKQVFGRVRELQPEIRDGVMLSVLQNLPQLCVEDLSLRECLRSLSQPLVVLLGVLTCCMILVMKNYMHY